MFELIFTHPWKGGAFHWNLRRIGVTSWRIGPFLFKYWNPLQTHIVRKRKINESRD